MMFDGLYVFTPKEKAVVRGGKITNKERQKRTEKKKNAKKQRRKGANHKNHKKIAK